MYNNINNNNNNNNNNNSNINNGAENDDFNDDGPIPKRTPMLIVNKKTKTRPSDKYSWRKISEMIDEYMKIGFPCCEIGECESQQAINEYLKSKHPLKLLQQMQEQYPQLSPVVRLGLRYFHTPASSAPTERVWSQATLALPSNRQLMTSGHSADVIMVKSNNKFVEEYLCEYT